MADDDDRLGVVRDSMRQNPLLTKAPIGAHKASSLNPDLVYGRKTVKTDGGAAAAMGKDRLQTPPVPASVQQAQKKNPLLMKIVGKTHGKANIKAEGAKDVMGGWKGDGEAGRSKPGVGQPRVPISSDANVSERVHGAKTQRKDPSAGELLKSWSAADNEKRDTSNPLLQRSQIGAPKPPSSSEVVSKTHGKKSTDPKIMGGVSGALDGWSASEDFGPTSKYKADVGRARPGVSGAADTLVHGKASLKNPNGARDALSDWRPDTPKGPPKPHRDVPKDLAFGMSSKPNEPVSDLMTTKYADEWRQQQKK